jgi:ABC-type polysaccharide/polyol phosphate transport system ATPase subunit
MAAAIEIDHVSKRFRLFREKPSSLKARLISSRSRAEDFWALKDVAFEVREGESLGLIGHNGSGKTTLLKVVAGILRPTEGIVRTRGRMAALLELGAGFHPELTGRENVYLNASFLGLTRKDTDAVYEDIVAFAEIEDFMDNQVKFYSSGMLVRLGFAVAVHVDPEILLVDEVLAVGDKRFRNKCLKRIEELLGRGTTLFLVSHSEGNLLKYCERGLYLESGEMRADGPIADVIEQYERDQGTWVEREPGLADSDFVDEVFVDSSSSDDAIF